jgi:4-hydroxy-tetrahydrodipicolinate reductase
MIRVGVSGAAGHMGLLTCQAVDQAPDLELAGRYAPGHGFDEPEALSEAEVVVEFTRPDVVMDNLISWRRFGCHAVVGTSGFHQARLEQLDGLWGKGPPNCLVVPNFSVGAVLLMWLAEKAAPHFSSAEVIDYHHDQKPDAPSGTALATAARLRPSGVRAMESTELLEGARGATDGEVRMHSVRLPGLLAHQEVLLGSPGEVLTIRHDATALNAYLPGILTAIRSVGTLQRPVTVGLESSLGLGAG